MIAFLSMPQGSEWIIILIVGLLVFGPRKLAEVGRAAGKAIRELRKSSEDLMSELKLDDGDLREDIEEITRLPRTLTRGGKFKG